MRVLAILAACIVAVAASEPTLEDFILSINDEVERWAVLDTVYRQNNNQIPRDLENILIRNRIPYPGMQPEINSYVPEPQRYELPSNLTRSQQIAMHQFMQEYRRNQAISAQHYVPNKIIERRRQPCHSDDDCPAQTYCSDIPSDLRALLKARGIEDQYYYVSELVDVHSKVCSKQPSVFMQNDAQKALPDILASRAKVDRVLHLTSQQKGMAHFVEQMKALDNFDMNKYVIYPTTRHAEIYHTQPQQQYPMTDSSGISPILLLSLLDTDSNDNGLSSIILLSMLGGTGMGGLGGAGGLGDVMNNPFLLLSLIGNDGGDGNDLMKLILLSQLGGGAGGNSLILPLYLISAQNNTDNSLLLLLLTGGLGGGGLGGGSHNCPPGASQNGLMQYLLYDALFDSGSDDNNLNLLFLLGGGGGCGGSAGDPMQLLLLQSILGDSGSGLGNLGNSSILTLLLLSGLGTGGSGGFDAPLLLLALFDDSFNSSNDLIKLAFLSDSNFLGNELALLLFFSGDLLGGDDSLASLLFLSLFMTGGNQGLTGSQTITTQPIAVTNNIPGLPPPGPAQITGSTYTVGGSQTSSSSTGGIFDGLFGGLGGGSEGGGYGLWQMILLFNLIGDGGFGSTDGILLLLMLQGSFFGGGQQQYVQQPAANYGPPAFVTGG